MVSSTESAIRSREHQRGLHAGVAHGDAVGHGDRGELARRAAAALTPSLTAWAWRDSAMLQGAASFQQVATPTKGWAISSGRSCPWRSSRSGAAPCPVRPRHAGSAQACRVASVSPWDAVFVGVSAQTSGQSSYFLRRGRHCGYVLAMVAIRHVGPIPCIREHAGSTQLINEMDLASCAIIGEP